MLRSFQFYLLFHYYSFTKNIRFRRFRRLLIQSLITPSLESSMPYLSNFLTLLFVIFGMHRSHLWWTGRFRNYRQAGAYRETDRKLRGDAPTAKRLVIDYFRRESPLLPRLLKLEMPPSPFESCESGIN